MKQNDIKWWTIIFVLTVGISILHYTTPTLKHHYHLIFMQAYFIPILLGAFQFGIKGGLGTALAVSVLYLPHIMFQWGGLVESNLIRFLQIALFNIIGYLTGLKAQREHEETERYHQTADQLKKSLDALELQSKQMTEIQDQLSQMDRFAVVGEMSANMAHEIRNPLGSIRGIADILKGEVAQTEKTAEFLGILVEETKRLSGLVDYYLGLARSEKSEAQVLELGNFLREIQLFFQYKAKQRKISFTLINSATEIEVLANVSQLRQVLINIILNALEALPEGGVISIASEKLSDSIAIKISDNGPGISPENQETIFKPMFTTKKSGTGLGLSIVKRIVQQNNWQLQMNSKPGLTEFSIILPLGVQNAQ